MNEPMASNMRGQLIALRKWLKDTGISSTTAWRWTRAGLISPVNVYGKLYLRVEDLEQFAARAKGGEFSRGPAGAAKRSARNRAAKLNTAT